VAFVDATLDVEEVQELRRASFTIIILLGADTGFVISTKLQAFQ